MAPVSIRTSASILAPQALPHRNSHVLRAMRVSGCYGAKAFQCSLLKPTLFFGIGVGGAGLR